MQKKNRLILGFLLFLCFLIGFSWFLFMYDNKYSTPPPYGQDGVLHLKEEDFSRAKPIYLIDGWMLSREGNADHVTYIGEFSNLQHGDLSKSPHGKATYRLTLRYDGAPKLVTLDFHELFSDYTIYVNDTVLTEGSGNARSSFLLSPGDTTLLVETSSQIGYYSGMYFPGSLGTDEVIVQAERIKTIIYAVAFLCSLVLAIFTLSLWNHTRDKVSFRFGLLCGSYALYVSYYFVHLLKLPFAKYWYFIEDLSLYLLIFFLIQLTHVVTQASQEKYAKITTGMAIFFPLALLSLHLLIPWITWVIPLHGQMKDLYFILIFLWLVVISVQCIRKQSTEYPYILAGNFVFGAGLLLNLLSSNLFEPIYALWQFEWCGLLLVFLFGGMMSARNRRILKENKEYSMHLDQLVEQRTKELSYVLQERRAFFSDMAHDLKAPLFATKTFIDAIRTHSVGIDDELLYYLGLVEQKQQEMSKRVQSLNTLNKLDKIEEVKEKLSICALLEEIYVTHNGEAEVSAVHLMVPIPETDAFIFMQQEKLLMVFENLIYNALRATPPNGSITIATKYTKKTVQFTITDTGCGISPSDLSLIFKRFYVGEENKMHGSGLGLYIAKSVIEDAKGTISATSQLGKGTSFILEIPRYFS